MTVLSNLPKQKMHVPTSTVLTPLLDEAADRHKHLCPRIVLGVRLGLAALRHLGLVDDAYAPRYINKRKRLFTFVEIDGCGADGICTATDCWLVRRTVRHYDYGKLAATIVDRQTGRAVRVAPTAESRERAIACQPTAQSRWHAYRDAYMILPDEQLVAVTPVTLTLSVEAIISRPGVRVHCAKCGEEIVNEREITTAGQSLCRACANGGYYAVATTAGQG